MSSLDPRGGAVIWDAPCGFAKRLMPVIEAGL
jgi:hypothetical protein